MAAQTVRQTAKRDYLLKVLFSHDFGIVVETHGTRGKSLAFSLATEYEAHWSNFSASRAGIGIILKKSFLDRFEPFVEVDIQEIEEGSLARLTLRGRDGNLDIWAVYLTTGEGPSQDVQARTHSRSLLTEHMAPNDSTLSIVAGDWNYLVHSQDRWCCNRKSWSGKKDKVSRTGP